MFKERHASFAAAMMLLLTTGARADTVFVDSDATGATDGTGWDDAYVALQDALAAAAVSGGVIDEVRIAGGTYAPDLGASLTPGDRFATFQLLDGVAIRGGFAGAGEPDPDARDLLLYETILTGDLSGDDTGAPDDSSHGENSLHVVTGSGVGASAVLDGVTITGGHANASGHTTGGGILNNGGSPTVTDCTIRANAASTGAGMENVAGSPRLDGCLFTVNLAVSRGGAVRNTSFGSPMFVHCVFDRNDGGAVGGAIESVNSGGGFPEFILCTFVGNFVTLDGGAISAKRRITITNSLFVGNSAVRGGAIRAEVQNSGALISGCTFNANVATSAGGAISSFCNSGCTTNTRVINAVAWGNTPDEVSGQQFAVTFSDVQGGLGGAGNIDADPLFIDPVGPDSTPGTGDENLRVQAGSPVVDAGANGGVPADVGDVNNNGDTVEDLPIDLDGNTRVVDGDDDATATVDMGVYEFEPNFAPTADAVVEQLTNIGEEALVRLDASGSSDVEDDASLLTYEWLVDDVTVCVGDAATCAVIEVSLAFGTHAIELVVTDTDGASSNEVTNVSLNAADLALLSIRRAKVDFHHDPGRVRLSGAVALPFGVDYSELTPMALVELDLAGFPIVDPVPILLELSAGHRWRYDVPGAPFGIRKLSIDWRGARFQFRRHHFPVKLESEIITSTETVLEIRYRLGCIDAPILIDVDGEATIEIALDGTVTASVPIEVDHPGRQVTATLPFPLLETSVVTFTGGAVETVQVADHYRNSVGRYRLSAEFDPALFPDGALTVPRTIDLGLALGDQFYAGTAALEETDLRVRGSKWRKRR